MEIVKNFCINQIWMIAKSVPSDTTSSNERVRRYNLYNVYLNGRMCDAAIDVDTEERIVYNKVYISGDWLEQGRISMPLFNMDEMDIQRVYTHFSIKTAGDRYHTSPYFKGIANCNLAGMIQYWYDYRGSDGENLYDLDDPDDAYLWMELYDASFLYASREISQFWIGGKEFIREKCMPLPSNKDLSRFIHIHNILLDLVSEFQGLVKGLSSEEIEKFVNADKYCRSNLNYSLLLKNDEQYGWCKYCKHYALESFSDAVFKDKKECYRSMLNDVNTIITINSNPSILEEFGVSQNYSLKCSKDTIVLRTDEEHMWGYKMFAFNSNNEKATKRNAIEELKLNLIEE